ncbi:MAG: FHA domain-containing protein [Halioglobus sp.]
MLENQEFVAKLVPSEGEAVMLEGETIVGRSADCGLTIDDAKVSRNHAVIKVEAKKVMIEDLGSSNGTRVNGLRIEKPTQAYGGDEISFEKHSFKLETQGSDEDLDATVVEMDDATVVDIPEPEPAPSTAPPSEPAAEKADEKPPEPEPKSEPAAVASGSFDLPGSWVDTGTGEETRVLSLDDIAPGVSAADVGRASDLPHLIVVSEGESAGAVFELQPGGTAESDVWEIGREERCEVVLTEESVSGRHAQLVHQGGRWRLVNLVSANGIFVNGEKRLTAYLADGDEITLGMATVVFHSALGGTAGAAPVESSGGDSGNAASNGSGAKIVALIVVGLAVAAGAYFFLQ